MNVLNGRDKRQPLDDIVQVSFPVLQALMNQLLENNTLVAASVMRLCLKIFWSATIYHLPAAQGNLTSLHCYCYFVIIIIFEILHFTLFLFFFHVALD